MGFKDSCRNTEKNAILRGHALGATIPEISKRLRLTERIVQNIIDFEEAKAKPKKKKAKKKAKAEPKAADDFGDEDFD